MKLISLTKVAGAILDCRFNLAKIPFTRHPLWFQSQVELQIPNLKIRILKITTKETGITENDTFIELGKT